MGKNNKIIFWLIPFMLILFGLAFYDYVYLAIKAEQQSLDELRETKQKTLEKYVNTIARKSVLENQINNLKESRKVEETSMVEGQTPSVAAANLQNMIKGIITGKGGTVSSERTEKPEDLSRYKIITVSVDAVLPETKALNDVLCSFETNLVALLMRELDVRVRNMREPRELMVKFKVSAINMGK
ncbi:MAG: type II secretion system protein GspM [Deltaproteobacteria bacterium]|nr:type II secretion system protein GspM [Deltaproteobacteria bacterium]